MAEVDEDNIRPDDLRSPGPARRARRRVRRGRRRGACWSTAAETSAHQPHLGARVGDAWCCRRDALHRLEACAIAPLACPADSRAPVVPAQSLVSWRCGAGRSIADRYRYEVGELMAIARAISSERDIRKLLGADPREEPPGHRRRRGQRLRRRGPGAQPARAHAALHAVAERFAPDRLQGVHAGRRRQVDRRQGGPRAPHQHPRPRPPGRPGQNPWGFQHNKSFDEKTGYRARSMLTVPMLSAADEVIGVIQLINKRRPAARLLAADDFDRVGGAVRRLGRGAGAGAGVAGRHLARERAPLRRDQAAVRRASSTPR